jgi:hypothetical protein
MDNYQIVLYYANFGTIRKFLLVNTRYLYFFNKKFLRIETHYAKLLL